MFSLLARIFIKDRKNYLDPKVREKYGLLSGVFDMVLNIILFAGKLTVGVICGSIAMTADAFNNLSDVGSS